VKASEGGVWTLPASGLPVVIAEVGVNHENDLERARRMIRQIAAAGGSAAKFQTYRAEKLASRYSPAYWDRTKEPTDSQFKLFKKYDRFGAAEYRALAATCEECGIAFLSTPFDLDAVEFLAPLMPAFKVASADISNLPLLEAVASHRRPVVLSTGASTLEEAKTAVRFLEEHGAASVAVLHCVLSYPTQPADANLRVILTLREAFPGYVVGYSDHVPPDPSMRTLTLAYALGAQIIEKHFTDDKSLPGNDHYHAMDEADLRTAVAAFAHARTLLGDGVKQVSAAERDARTYARRSLVAARPMAMGHLLAAGDIEVKRPGTGIPPTLLEYAIGRRLTRDVVEDEILTYDHVEGGAELRRMSGQNA
jgi:N-acetylneuraminate synthase